jgi:hypothetical protein
MINVLHQFNPLSALSFDREERSETEGTAESEESESGRSAETVWTVVPPDDRREKENTEREERERLTIEHDAILDEEEGVLYICALPFNFIMSRFCLVEAISRLSVVGIE